MSSRPIFDAAAPVDTPRANSLLRLPPLPASWRADCGWIVLAHLASRLFVAAVFQLRGLRFPFMDAGGYVAQAEWIARHGSLSVPEEAGARFFYGMPLLVSMLGRLTGEYLWTGYSLNLLAGCAAAMLFYRNFPVRDWGLLHALLLPAWVSTTATLHSEAGMWACALLTLLALRLEQGDPSRPVLLVIGGYALACRPTAGFILGPMLVCAWLPRSHRSWRNFFLDGLCVAVLPALLAVWTRIDTGTVFPQSRWQAKGFADWSNIDAGFPPRVFAWPGQSFLIGLFSPHLSPLLKLLNLGHVVVWGAALSLGLGALRRDPRDNMAILITLELAINGIFILTMGGPFGHTMYYRYLVTQANAFVVLAWLRHARVPRTIWWLAAAVSVALASAVARHS